MVSYCFRTTTIFVPVRTVLSTIFLHRQSNTLQQLGISIATKLSLIWFTTYVCLWEIPRHLTAKINYSCLENQKPEKGCSTGKVFFFLLNELDTTIYIYIYASRLLCGAQREIDVVVC